jgi:hypothetical protein
MKTEVIISIIAVVVILAIIAYVVYKKDRFTLAGTYMTPLEIANQKGYSQVVAYLNYVVEQNNNIAQRIVNQINCAEETLLQQYRPGILANVANISVPVQNCDGTNITPLQYTTPLQIVNQKGHSQVVAYLNEQVALPTPSIIQTAQLLVNIINCGVSEDDITVNIAHQMNDMISDDIINTSVLVQNCDLPA